MISVSSLPRLIFTIRWLGKRPFLVVFQFDSMVEVVLIFEDSSRFTSKKVLVFLLPIICFFFLKESSEVLWSSIKCLKVHSLVIFFFFFFFFEFVMIIDTVWRSLDDYFEFSSFLRSSNCSRCPSGNLSQRRHYFLRNDSFHYRCYTVFKVWRLLWDWICSLSLSLSLSLLLSFFLSFFLSHIFLT